MPGAFFSRSARVQTLAPLAKSSLSSRVTWALRDLGLQADDAVGGGLGIGAAGFLHHRFDIGAIFGAKRGHVGAVAQIIFALGHAEAALHQIGDLLARRAEPLGDENPEQIVGREIGRVERVDVGAQRRADRRRQGALVGDRGDRIEVGLGRGHAGLVDRVGVRDRRCRNRGSCASLLPAAGLDLRIPSISSRACLLALLVGDVEAADRASGRPGSRCSSSSCRWRRRRSRRPASRSCPSPRGRCPRR